MTTKPTTTRAVFRSAEDLYGQLPVRDVVRVLAKTKEDAEKKREELRELVGRRYHDLIDSADAIISMNDTVVGFEKMLLTIESTASSLLSDASKVSASTSKKSKRKQDEFHMPDKGGESTVSGTSADAAAPLSEVDLEREKIELLLRAPTEIWSALDENNDLKAAKILVHAQNIVKQLQINTEMNGHGETGSSSEELEEALGDFGLTEPLLSTCRNLVRKSEADRDMCGPWLLKFPFLISQSKLLENCKQDIIRSGSAAFAERQISAARIEQVVEALMFVGEISNPLASLLTARTQALQSLAKGDEDSVFAVAELAARTVRDSAWIESRFGSKNATSDVVNWIDTVASPVAKSLSDAVCAKTTSVSSLASLQRSLKESIKKVDIDATGQTVTHHSNAQKNALSDDALFQRLFGNSFMERAVFLLASSYDNILRKVKRVLNSVGSTSDDKRNIAAFQAFELLQKGIASVENDSAELTDVSGNNGSGKKPNIVQMGSSNWLAELVSWLDQRQTPAVARFCDILGPFINENKIARSLDFESRLAEISRRAMTNWAESLVKRLGEEFESRAGGLPWTREGRQGSSQLGGWTTDETHGDLPSVPSWPAAELCFQVARNLDHITDAFKRGGSACAEADAKLRKLTGDLAWRRLHTIYTALAKDASGADGKLQAAFDLEYCSIALLDAARPPLPFTSGGVDVYACSDVLRARAKAFAASSRLLNSTWTSKATGETNGTVHETKVGAHALLTVVEPVPRFALLPVPQKRATTPRLVNRSSSHVSSDSYGDIAASSVNASASATKSASSSAAAGFGRVLGWLT